MKDPEQIEALENLTRDLSNRLRNVEELLERANVKIERLKKLEKLEEHYDDIMMLAKMWGTKAKRKPRTKKKDYSMLYVKMKS